MKILYIITRSDIGGAQVHLSELIFNLPIEIESYVVVGSKGWLSNNLHLPKERIYIVPSLVREISILKDICFFVELRKIVDNLKPDIIHCHSSKAGIIGRVVAKIYDIPSVFTAHGWAFTEGIAKSKRFFFENIERIVAKYTNKIICVSDYDKNLALKVMPEYHEKLIVIHNGIKEKRLSVSYLKDGKYLNVVMIARFSIQKDQKLLIDAIDELNKEGVHIRLNLVGDGPEKNNVRIYSESKSYANNIFLLGERTDIMDILARNDVVALISKWEGFPICILEAMCQGKPVVASDVGGVNEAVIEGKTGFLVPRGNKEILKDKLKQLYDNKDLIIQLGENARKNFMNRFLTEIMMKKILRVYREIYIGVNGRMK